MQCLETCKAKLDKVLYEKNQFSDILEKIETKTGIKRTYFAFGALLFVIVYLIVGYGSQFLANFIGFIYPAYCSVKAIESSQKDDDTQWLIYWVVYAAFSLVEFFTDILLFWIPLYALMKCLFLIYCMAPIKTNGATLIYEKVLRPLVIRHQHSIDQAMDRTADLAGEFLEESKKRAKDIAVDSLLDSAKLQ